MIDWRHQGRGIGRAALAALAEQRAAAGATHLLLSCVADVPGSPEPFYPGSVSSAPATSTSGARPR